MKEVVNFKTEHADNWPVRPLTRTRRDSGAAYHRETEVEAQVQELSRLGERARRERLLSDALAWSDTDRVREETLVYFAREYDSRGDGETAWKIAETLIGRAAAHVQRKMGRWRLSPEEAEDCARDLFTALCESLFDRGPAAEFWEVRFWVCLDRRLWNLIEKRQAVIDNEISPADQSDASESESADTDRLFARIADRNPGPETQAMMAEALSLLADNERTALFLCYVEGLPEESDDPERLSAAKVLGVTGRSVRNYLRRAKDKLAQWEQAALKA